MNVFALRHWILLISSYMSSIDDKNPPARAKPIRGDALPNAAEKGPTWPTHFPEDCPPKCSTPLDGKVLYLVEYNPPEPKDFLSALERGVFQGKPLCLRASLSTGLDVNYMRSLRESIPRLRKRHIAGAVLAATHGFIKQTGRPGHHSMWLTREALTKAPQLFEVLE